jgi:tRNA dimethylallyltransferase
MKKLLIICGPTATGKTNLALYLAKKFAGELISADSRQVYKGMNIGTGKDVGGAKFIARHFPPKVNPHRLDFGYFLVNGVKIWGLDIADPDYKFNVSDYMAYVQIVLEEIYKRNKLPILVGGTGLYIKAVVDGVDTANVPPNEETRKKLKNIPASELFSLLSKSDPKKARLMNNSDKNNLRRLIRAIEIAEFNKSQKKKEKKSKNKFNPLFIGLTGEKNILARKIEQRVNERLEKNIIDEVMTLVKKGYDWHLPSMSGLGYREWKPYLENKDDLEKTIKRWKTDEYRFALRQLTWFNKDKRIHWFDINSSTCEIEKMLADWYNKTRITKSRN